MSERLVHAGKRLATRLDAEWFAIYVETPSDTRLSKAERDRVAYTLRQAEALGARAVTLPGRTVAEYAYTHNVTKIVAGKPLRGRWAEFLRGSIVDQIIRESRDIDVYVTSSTDEAPPTFGSRSFLPTRMSWRPYVESIGLVALASLLGAFIHPFIAPTNLVMLYLLAIVVAAIRHGHGSSIAVAVLSVVAFDVFFIPPRFTFAVEDAQYLLTFTGLLLVGVVISTLAARAREAGTGRPAA